MAASLSLIRVSFSRFSGKKYWAEIRSRTCADLAWVSIFCSDSWRARSNSTGVPELVLNTGGNSKDEYLSNPQNSSLYESGKIASYGLIMSYLAEAPRRFRVSAIWSRARREDRIADLPEPWSPRTTRMFFFSSFSSFIACALNSIASCNNLSDCSGFASNFFYGLSPDALSICFMAAFSKGYLFTY